MGDPKAVIQTSDLIDFREMIYHASVVASGMSAVGGGRSGADVVQKVMSGETAVDIGSRMPLFTFDIEIPDDLEIDANIPLDVDDLNEFI